MMKKEDIFSMEMFLGKLIKLFIAFLVAQFIIYFC